MEVEEGGERQGAAEETLQLDPFVHCILHSSLAALET